MKLTNIVTQHVLGPNGTEWRLSDEFNPNRQTSLHTDVLNHRDEVVANINVKGDIDEIRLVSKLIEKAPELFSALVAVTHQLQKCDEMLTRMSGNSDNCELQEVRIARHLLRDITGEEF